MDLFVQKFCDKYVLSLADAIQLVEKMRKFSFRKGDCLVKERECHSSYYIIAEGGWRGYYLNEGMIA